MTTDKKYDVIVVGAGHNGLVAANYLAKAGRKVLVLERRDRAGGQLSAEELGGVAFDPLHAGAQLRPDIVRDLDLLRPIYAKTAAYGHFGRTDVDLPWEQLNKVDELKASV